MLLCLVTCSFRVMFDPRTINKDSRKCYFLKDSKKLYRPHFNAERCNRSQSYNRYFIYIYGRLIDYHVRTLLIGYICLQHLRMFLLSSIQNYMHSQKVQRYYKLGKLINIIYKNSQNFKFTSHIIAFRILYKINHDQII